ILVRLNFSAKTPEHGSQVFELFLPSASALCDQDSDSDSALYRGCERVEHLEVVASEYGQQKRPVCRTNEFQNRFTPRGGSKHKAICLLAYFPGSHQKVARSITKMSLPERLTGNLRKLSVDISLHSDAA